jgi:hypothetical protein
MSASAPRRYNSFSFVSDGKVGGLEKIGKGEKTVQISSRLRLSVRESRFQNFHVNSESLPSCRER